MQVMKVGGVAAVGAVIALGWLGCGGGGGDFSCTTMGATGGTSCYEYKNLSGDQLSTVKSSCKGTQGTVCPTAGLTGCCTLTVSSTTTTTCYYGLDGSKGCTGQGGTWSTTP